jgi:hypothetical protein
VGLPDGREGAGQGSSHPSDKNTMFRQRYKGMLRASDTMRLVKGPPYSRSALTVITPPPLCLPPDSCTISWEAGCRELRAALAHAGQLLATTANDVTITIPPAITKITLGTSLKLPTLAGNASLTVAGPKGVATRPVVAFAPNSAGSITRAVGAGAATRIAFQDLDFEEVFFLAQGPGELGFTNVDLAPAAGSTATTQAFQVYGSLAGGRPRLALNRVVVKDFIANLGGAVFVYVGDVIATGAAGRAIPLLPTARSAPDARRAGLLRGSVGPGRSLPPPATWSSHGGCLAARKEPSQCPKLGLPPCGLPAGPLTHALMHCPFCFLAVVLGGRLLAPTRTRPSPPRPDTLFTNCRSVFAGGAFFADLGSSSSFTRCSFVGNIAGTSGAAYYANGATATAGTVATFVSCLFQDNKAKYDAAVKLATYSEATVQGSLFWGNKAGGQGGAITCAYCEKLQVVDSILAGNTAREQGGLSLVMTSIGDARVESCTFSGNTATVAGAATELHISSSDAQKLRVTNCIFDSPTSDNFFDDAGGKLEITDTICWGATAAPCPSGTGVTNNVDPQLSALQTCIMQPPGTWGPTQCMVPLTLSPAIDAGSSTVSAAPGAVDFAGNPRVGVGPGQEGGITRLLVSGGGWRINKGAARCVGHRQRSMTRLFGQARPRSLHGLAPEWVSASALRTGDPFIHAATPGSQPQTLQLVARTSLPCTYPVHLFILPALAPITARCTTARSTEGPSRCKARTPRPQCKPRHTPLKKTRPSPRVQQMECWSAPVTPTTATPSPLLCPRARPMAP